MAPLGLAPIFAALTRGYPEKRKREAAIRGTILGAIIFLIFALAGDALLGALGIGLPAFRTAGGILLFLLAALFVFDGLESILAQATPKPQGRGTGRLYSPAWHKIP